MERKTEKEKIVDLLIHVGNMRILRCSFEECADELIAAGVSIPVRCKDCEHFTASTGLCHQWECVSEEDGFCHRAEPKKAGIPDNDR